AMLYERQVVLFPFRREMKQQRSSGFGISFRHQSFLDHRLYGAMHHGAVEAKLRGNLVLIQGGAMPQGGKNETTSRRAAGLSFQTLANREVGCYELSEQGILEDFVGNLGFGDHLRRGPPRVQSP